MTISLDQIIEIGPLRIAMLCERDVKVVHGDGVVFFVGRKTPVAVLIMQGAALNAFEPEGNPMTREHVDSLCPGVWRTLLDTHCSL